MPVKNRRKDSRKKGRRRNKGGFIPGLSSSNTPAHTLPTKSGKDGNTYIIVGQSP